MQEQMTVTMENLVYIKEGGNITPQTEAFEALVDRMIAAATAGEEVIVTLVMPEV